MSNDPESADRLEELLGQRDADEGAGPDAPQDPGPADTHDPPVPDAPEAAPGGGRLPDAPLFALLRTIEAEIGVERIDRVWIFPPRRIEAGETAVVVVAAYPELDHERRRVYAAHYNAPAQGDAPRLALQEFGTAPAERVGRVVEEVAERLKEHPAATPQVARIEGATDRWHGLLHSLAEKRLDETTRHPRLRGPLDPRRV
jgi:hypothetical protein